MESYDGNIYKHYGFNAVPKDIKFSRQKEK